VWPSPATAARVGRTVVGEVRVIDSRSGKFLRAFDRHKGAVLAVTATRDGKLAISAGADRTIRVWEVDTAREVKVLEGHTTPVRGVTLSPDGRHVASCGGDRTVRIWELETGREVLRLAGSLRVDKVPCRRRGRSSWWTRRGSRATRGTSIRSASARTAVPLHRGGGQGSPPLAGAGAVLVRKKRIHHRGTEDTEQRKSRGEILSNQFFSGSLCSVSSVVTSAFSLLHLPPLAYSRRMYWSASGAFDARRWVASQISFLPTRYATLPRWFASVSQPE